MKTLLLPFSAVVLLSIASILLALPCEPVTAREEPVLPSEREPSQGKKTRTVAITLTLDTDRVRVGDEVVLTQTVPEKFKMNVFCLRFDMTVLGKWNAEKTALILFESRDWLTSAPELADEKNLKDFEGFARTILAPARDRFPADEKGETQSMFTANGVKGVRNKVKAIHPGLYMFTAVWKQKDPDPELVSVPVILTVEPKP